MYRFVFLLCFFSRTILCTPNMDILPNSNSSEVCEDFIILGGNFESVTFKVTGNDSTFLINRFHSPELILAADKGRVCPLIGLKNDCRSLFWDQYTCTCEQKGPEEFHLTFNNTPNATREPFTLYMKWIGVNNKIKTSNNFTFKEVKGDSRVASVNPPGGPYTARTNSTHNSGLNSPGTCWALCYTHSHKVMYCLEPITHFTSGWTEESKLLPEGKYNFTWSDIEPTNGGWQNSEPY